MMRDRMASWLWILPILAVGCQPAPDEAPVAEPAAPEVAAAPPDTTQGAPAEEPTGPPQGEGTATSADGVEIAYTVQGAGEPALVFIHGWSCDQSFWSEQVDAFAGDRAVVTVDLAGHGASGRGRGDWTIESFGPDIVAVIESLELEKVILVGHSMGGPAALEAARRVPERIVGVIGADTFHNAEQEVDPEQWKQLLGAYEIDFAATCRGFVSSMFPGGADPALMEGTVTKMCDAPPEIAIALMGDFGTYDVGDAMSAAAVPIRAINSTMYATEVDTNRVYAPSFEVVEMEGVGHFVMNERPLEFNQLLAEAVEALENR